MSTLPVKRTFGEFDLSDGRDEANLAEFPIGLLSEKGYEDKTTVVFQDGQGGTLTIYANSKYGLPTATDDDVLLALLTLTKFRTDFKSERLSFSRRDILRILDWPDSGASYDRLKESIKRLASLQLEFDGCWWDNGRGRRGSLTFHAIEVAWVYNPNGSDEDDADGSEAAGNQTHCWIIWNQAFIEGCRNGNVRRLDLNVYLSFSSPIAKKLYRLLAKLLRNRDAWTFDLMTLAIDRLKLSEAYRKDAGSLKIKLRKGIEELEAIGFIVKMTDEERYHKLGPGKWTARFVKGPNFRADNLAEANPDIQPVPRSKSKSKSKSKSQSASQNRETVIETTAAKIEFQFSASTPAQPEPVPPPTQAAYSDQDAQPSPASAPKRQQPLPLASASPLEAPSGLSETISLLVDRGVALKRATTLAAKYGDEIVRERIAIFDWTRKRDPNGTGKNPAGWLVASIEKGFEIPEDYRKSQEKKKQRAQQDQAQLRDQLKHAKNRAESAETNRLAEIIDAMSPEEFAELKQAALAEMDPAMRRLYEKMTPESVREKWVRTPMRETLQRRGA